MTVQQMHDEFKLGLDKVDTAGAPNFLAAEIDSFLNEAQEEFIEQRLWGTNAKKQGLEETQKRRDDLRTLIVEIQIQNNNMITGSKPLSRKYLISDFLKDYGYSYRHMISETAIVKYDDCNGNNKTEVVVVTPLTADRYGTTLKDPFNKPGGGRVYRMDYSDGFEVLFGAGTILQSWSPRFIKEPAVISLGNTDCELALHTHREVVNIAVMHALGNIESPRAQLQMMENMQQE